ncbi:MAG: D-glycero-beta-D-manno-heptose 1-phosphate adenylyltransferase [Armatimonadetes bacterium]|nr:D-glycero-beta-D-manno-heptose 1-phosphate adenylyltransferase [Armatimonadota bacterium]
MEVVFTMDCREKIVPWDEVDVLVARLRREGKTIVFTNGVFDLLHVGHIRYLQEARSYGDVLVLGLNSDASTRRIKGPRRPIVPEGERAEMVAALECVDYVVIFQEDTPDELIRKIAPDVHVKGGDYTPDELPEAPLVRSLGGRVVVTSLVNGKSTTMTIGRILATHVDLIERGLDQQ